MPACGRFACAIRGVGACASGRGERADYAGSIREKNEPGGHERRPGEGPPWGADRAILHGFCGSSAEGGGEENRGQKRRGATLGLLRGGKSLRNSTYHTARSHHSAGAHTSPPITCRITSTDRSNTGASNCKRRTTNASTRARQWHRLRSLTSNSTSARARCRRARR